MLKRFRSRRPGPRDQVKQGFVVGVLLNFPWLCIALGSFVEQAGNPDAGFLIGFGFMFVLAINLLGALILYLRGFSAYAWRGFLIAFVLSIFLIPTLCASGA